MTQSIVLQVGQCGNQIGNRFWSLALQEHASANKVFSSPLKLTQQNAVYDNALSTFFVNGAADDSSCLRTVSRLKARAVLIDMEEGVVSELFKGPMRHIYDHRFLITDVSGSGNNWAVGKFHYGRRYHTELLDVIRKSAELCDCLQSFLVIHSLGGGTGSGIGTHVLQMLADEYPNVYRVITSVFPAMDDDVITSPYNTVLGTGELTELADCVIPIDNTALTGMAIRLREVSADNPVQKPFLAKQQTKSPWPTDVNQRPKPFDEMNNIVASMLLNLTSSCRFEGTMNVDINEISMNLVPFPRLHYLIAAQSPLTNLLHTIVPRSIDQMFSDAFTRDLQLISTNPCRHTYLATALFVRGAIPNSDVRRNIEKLQQRLRFVPWNRDGWKVGHCLTPAIGLPRSLLVLSNNTSIRERFSDILERFWKLFKRKAHLHHYTSVDGFELEMFTTHAESMADLCSQYEVLEQKTGCEIGSRLPRLQISS